MNINYASKYRSGDLVRAEICGTYFYDVVRVPFMTEGDTVDPTPKPALVLTDISWVLESDCKLISTEHEQAVKVLGESYFA